MAENSGHPAIQMKFWLANKQAQIKKQSIKQENEQLKLDNEILTAENHQMRQLQGRRNLCGTCIRMENAYLRAEIERLSTITARQNTEALPQAELRFSPTASQISADTEETGRDQ